MAAETVTLEVRHTSDVSVARRQVKALATTLGFDSIAMEEIALAVSELASNLVKHATGGTLTLTAVAAREQTGIQLESRDQGPGIANVEEALADGFSTTGSLGCGLGAVNRLMDELDIQSRPGQGTRIVCRRWLRRTEWAVRQCPLAFGAASRPHPGADVNGDAFVIKRWGTSALVAVIDGLGHGVFAHRAAQTARQYVENHYDRPLTEIFRGVGRSCRSTRGVVMALARFDWADVRMTFASIGNIEARVFGTPQPLRLVVRRGVLGGSAPNAVVSEHPWQPQYILVLHSDGMTSHWQWRDFPDLDQEPASRIAQRLLLRLAKPEDDATVLVVRDEVS